MNLKSRAKKLKTDIPAVFLALKHPRTPWTAKVLVAVAVAYALSPIDLIPDFIPLLGYLDDILLLPALIALAMKLIPADVLAQCQAQAEGLWTNGMPKRWYYALPIIFFWGLLAYFIARLIWFKK